MKILKKIFSIKLNEVNHAKFHSFNVFSSAKEMKYLRQLEDLRDEILGNHEGNNATHVFREMCGSDLKLLKEWTWDRFV